jgi:hypothetical protein
MCERFIKWVRSGTWWRSHPGRIRKYAGAFTVVMAVPMVGCGSTTVGDTLENERLERHGHFALILENFQADRAADGAGTGQPARGEPSHTAPTREPRPRPDLLGEEVRRPAADDAGASSQPAVTVRSGTRLRAYIDRELSTARSQPGDLFVATIESLEGQGDPIIERLAGGLLHGQVVAARSGTLTEPPELTLRVTSVTVGGRSATVNAPVTGSSARREKAMGRDQTNLIVRQSGWVIVEFKRDIDL